MQQEIKKSPLIHSSVLLPNRQTILLVSCCNVNGGLYLINFSDSTFAYKKVMNGDCRGIARYENSYVIPSNTHGLLLLDDGFHIKSQYTPESIMDYHGVAVKDNYAYVIETSFNTIGIYKLPELDRIDEIVLDPAREDVRHINDIFIRENNIFLSMFSSNIKWRDCPVDSGVLVRIDLQDLSNIEVLFSGLKHPHSIRQFRDDLVFCNSAGFEVFENSNFIFKSTGYLRGIEKVEDTYFIGQSGCRNVDWIRKENTNLSIDSGIHVFHEKEKISQFFSLPSPEMYAILDCSKIIAPDVYDNIKSIDPFEQPGILSWRLYIDTGKGLNDEEVIQQLLEPGVSVVNIDLSAYNNIKAVRFDPGDFSCIFLLNSITAFDNENQFPMIISQHTARFEKNSYYYFDQGYPQLTISNMPKGIKSMRLEFSIYIGHENIERELAGLIEQICLETRERNHL